MNDFKENKYFLDKKIAAIQESTVTKNYHLQKFNELLRQRFRWYYNLRINPRYAGKDLDDQIIRIQNSTKTRIRRLQPIHDHLRQKFEWYYGWHLRPFSSTLHVATAVAYTCSIAIFCFYFVFSANPGVSSAKFGDPKTNLEKKENQEHSQIGKPDKKNDEINQNNNEAVIPDEIIEENLATNESVTPPEDSVAPPSTDTPDESLTRENANTIQPGNPPTDQIDAGINAPTPNTNQPADTTAPTPELITDNAPRAEDSTSDTDTSPQQGRSVPNPNRSATRTDTSTPTIQVPPTVISVETVNTSILLKPQQTQSQPQLVNPVATLSSSYAPIIGFEIIYGTNKNNLDQKILLPPTTQPQTVDLPNLRPRTYYYQVVTVDNEGGKQYSEINTIKNGNRLIRFFADKLDWILDKVIGGNSVISHTGLLP